LPRFVSHRLLRRFVLSMEGPQHEIDFQQLRRSRTRIHPKLPIRCRRVRLRPVLYYRIKLRLPQTLVIHTKQKPRALLPAFELIFFALPYRSSRLTHSKYQCL